jgi:hypothetical protein
MKNPYISKRQKIQFLEKSINKKIRLEKMISLAFYLIEKNYFYHLYFETRGSGEPVSLT